MAGNSGYLLIVSNPTTREGACIKSTTCPSGYVNEGGKCLFCAPTCNECVKGNNPRSCKGCTSGYRILSSSLYCSNPCPSIIPISDCIVVPCTSFSSPPNEESSCLLECPDGFYLSIDKFENCNSSRTKCVVPTTNDRTHS